MATENERNSINSKEQKNTSQQNTSLKSDKAENNTVAHQQAEEDIQKDADFSISSPNEDLDEGEMVRLGEDKNDLA